VRSAIGEAKFWLKPEATLAWSEGLYASTLRELHRVVQDNVNLIEEAWHDHFG
jgi:hypothetical protein